MNRLTDFTRQYFKLITFFFVVIAASLLFATGIMRGQCIAKGYELSNLSAAVEGKRIEMERIEAERSKILAKESLFALAKQRGFVMMNEGKTFNVQ